MDFSPRFILDMTWIGFRLTEGGLQTVFGLVWVWHIIYSIYPQLPHVHPLELSLIKI